MNIYQKVWAVVCLIALLLLLLTYRGGQTPRTALSGHEMDTGVMLSAPSNIEHILHYQGDTRVFFTRNERPIRDPRIHYLVYHVTMACLKQRGDPKKIQWRMAQAIYDRNNNRYVAGLYIHADSTRKIILDIEYLFDPQTISHEVLHDLTQRPDNDPDFGRARILCELGYQGG